MVTFRQIYFADELPQRRVWRGAGVAACRGAFAPGTHYGVWARLGAQLQKAAMTPRLVAVPDG
jgi:hypothetical protein